MVELLQTSLSADKPIVLRRKALKVCVASIVSLSASHLSATAFSPSLFTTASSSIPKAGSHQTSVLVTTSTPQRRVDNGKGGHACIINSKKDFSLLALRSAVMQSYRVEDDPNISNAFSFLPSRLSSIERIDTPSQFKSIVIDEQISLIVVRFYADACPSCKATSALFRRWSRDMKRHCEPDSLTVSNNDRLNIKIVEMPLNKATSSFLQNKLHIDQIPYCHLYHPQMGLVEEQLVINKVDFRDFRHVVHKWAARLTNVEYDTSILCSKDDLIEDCEEFC